VTAGAVKFTIVVLPVGVTVCQENGPTVEVMSAVPLKAKASKSQLSGPAGAPFDKQEFDNVGGWVDDLAILILVMCW
jgi:hypothetical protein